MLFSLHNIPIDDKTRPLELLQFAIPYFKSRWRLPTEESWELQLYKLVRRGIGGFVEQIGAGREICGLHVDDVNGLKQLLKRTGGWFLNDKFITVDEIEKCLQ
jgi:hypothetical protein